MGSPWVDLTRSKDGKHRMCCICFEWIPVEKLFVDQEGTQWDNCVPCAPQAGHETTSWLSY